MSKYTGKDFLIQLSIAATVAWAGSTAVTLGVVRTNGGNAYQCITAGTTAASGGPTTTSADITDGTAHWKYLGAVTGGVVNTTIGGLRSTGMTINNEQVDVTDKGDVPWRQLLAGAGVRSMSLSGSGVFSDNAAVTTLQADAMSGTFETLKLISGRGDSFTGSFQIATFERNGEYNGAEQFSVSFESAAQITYTPAP